MNVALSELPRFSCLPEPGDHLTGGIILAPSLAYMERAFADARQFGWSKAPIVELLIPSTLDDSLAPPGQHVASLFCQHVQPVLSGGRSWDDHRAKKVADLMIDTVETWARGSEGLGSRGRQITSPLDLERTFGLVNGDIMHGVLSPRSAVFGQARPGAPGLPSQPDQGPFICVGLEPILAAALPPPPATPPAAKVLRRDLGR